MLTIQDSHCHPLRTLLNPSEFESQWLNAKIDSIVFCTTHPQEWEQALKFGHCLKKIKHSLYFGIHPWWAQAYSNRLKLDATLERLEALILQNPSFNMGECGLDGSIKRKIPLQIQEQVLIGQLQIAHKNQRKVNLHCVKATGRLQTLVSQFSGLDYTLHSYKGSRESTEIWIKLGAKFSLGKRSFEWSKIHNQGHKQEPMLHTLQKLYSYEPHRIGFESDAPDAGDASTVGALYQFWLSLLNTNSIIL